MIVQYGIPSIKIQQNKNQDARLWERLSGIFADSFNIREGFRVTTRKCIWEDEQIKYYAS